MKFHVVIPARYASSRFPGKPLVDIHGKAMVCHVVDRANQSGADTVTVATDDIRIKEAAEQYGADVALTRSDHESGTDRLEEAAAVLGLDDQDIVVNVQGDEPLINPEFIRLVAQNLADNPQCSVATLCEPISESSQYFNPNVVKAVFNHAGQCLYFSRAPVPWNRDVDLSESTDMPGHTPAFRHLGIYAYRVSALKGFVSWPTGRLEQIEKLEQLRFMENGHSIHITPVAAEGNPGVDTPEDLEKVRQLLSS